MENNSADHGLTVKDVFSLWTTHMAPEYGIWAGLPSRAQMSFIDAVRSAYDMGNEANNGGWEPLGFNDPLYTNDEVKREYGGFTLTDVVKTFDRNGNPVTEQGRALGSRYLGTWYVRRAVMPAVEVELETKHPAHLTDVTDVAYRTHEHMSLDRDGRWHGLGQDGYFRTWGPYGILSATHPDHGPIRRDGDYEDGTPRFVVVTEDNNK